MTSFIDGLDSEMPPNDSQIAQAKAAGVRVWSGYLATGPGYGIRPWAKSDFDRVQNAGLGTIGFCSGNDDPVGVATLARAWKIRTPGLDDEDGIRQVGSWEQGWVAAARTKSLMGLYGNAQKPDGTSLHDGVIADFHIVAAYPNAPPVPTTWIAGLHHPPTPCGWQYRGTHTEFGIEVDRSWLDPWFAQAPSPPPSVEDNMQDLLILLAEDHGMEQFLWGVTGRYLQILDPTTSASLQALKVPLAKSSWGFIQGIAKELGVSVS